MANYTLSAEADIDLSDVYEYSFREFGPTKADLYSQHLVGCFERLADNPLLGEDRSDLSPGLRYLFCQSHALYYFRTGPDILIVRILHQSMDARKHL